MQAILDTALAQAADDAKVRFEVAISAIPPAVNHVVSAIDDDATAELREWLRSSAAVDTEALLLLAGQADRIREFDRMFGARSAESLMSGYLSTLKQLRAYAVAPNQREALADLYADAAALAGWQTLDLGQLAVSWHHYEAAKDAGREGRSRSALVHAMAEQAYVLLDLGENARASELATYARSVAKTSVPELLQAWLLAVEGETRAVAGDAYQTQRAFDAAQSLLPNETVHPDLPYIVLDEHHLSRWRGSALASLGEATAIDELGTALQRLDATFNRARAGLHVDLAQAFVATNQQTEAREQLKRAGRLADRVGSARQRRRIQRLHAVLPAG